MPEGRTRYLPVNGNLYIEGSKSQTKLPLDWRYGPWESLQVAYAYMRSHILNLDKTYYGLTVGVYIYDKNDHSRVIGIDEYWWQPDVVYDENTDTWSDGFVRKFPANSPLTVDNIDGKILGVSQEENDYDTEWREDDTDPVWHDIVVQQGLGSSQGS